MNAELQGLLHLLDCLTCVPVAFFPENQVYSNYLIETKLFFRSTSDLETFQNLILKYASKRNSYKPPAFAARNILAALDHNANVDREAVKN